MSIQLVCPCGKALRVSEAHAGRRVRCPACGSEHLVPAAGEAPRQGTRVASGRGRLLLLALGGTLLLIAAGLGLAWLLTRSAAPAGSEIDDLTLIPSTARAFACLRLGEIWAIPAVQKAIEAERGRDPNRTDLAAQLERDVGLRPEQVERLSIVAQELSPPLGWAVARTREPYHRSTLLAKLTEQREGQVLGRRYTLGRNRDGQAIAVSFLSPHVVVVGTEAGVRRCLTEQQAAATAGPLTPLIARAREPHHGVAGAQVNDEARQQLKANELLRVLAEVRSASATLTVGDKVAIDVRGQFPDEAAAAQVQKTLPGLLAKARLMLPLMAALRGGDEGKLLGQLAGLVNKLQTEQEGSEVSGRLDVETADAVGGLMRLPAGR